MTYQEFIEQFHIRLNPAQEAAVKTVNGPCLLLAVPGSGKTTVLVTRLGYMIRCLGIAPENILTLTYTVSATKDMTNRYISIFGDGDQVEFRTINGISSKIIAFYGRSIGRASFELEANEKDRLFRISRAYQEATRLYPTESDISEISTGITYIKNMMYGEEEIKKLEESCEYPLYNIYTAYNNSLKDDGRMDYDDQMVYAYKILKCSPDTLRHFQNQYQYICVDEAQDTSKIQHMLIRLLAGSRDNLFMVGDEDQSIYGFRAAYPQALLSFEKDHPGAKVLLMEENYRSNANIVDAADTFIQKNRLRHKKTLRATRDAGSAVTKIQVNGRAGQYEYLKNIAENCTEETAVLYKDNESILPLVDLLDRSHVPFQMKNADLSFFTNKVTVDITNILKFAMNPSDEELFMSFYYKLGLYMTKKEAEMVCAFSQHSGLDIPAAGLKYRGLSDGARSRFEDFAHDIRFLKSKKPVTAVSFIDTTLGYGRYLQQRHISNSKIYTIKELFQRCNTIQEALSRLQELSELIKNHSFGQSGILFSTIHSSKGLEYKNVYLLDAIDGVFPDRLFSGKREELESYEELRRLFYVGITRAKDNLFLFRTGDASTFIDEMTVKKNVDKKAPALSVAFEDYCNALSPGRKVIHKKFGEGAVISTKVPFVSIEFGGEKRTFGIQVLYEKNVLSII